MKLAGTEKYSAESNPHAVRKVSTILVALTGLAILIGNGSSFAKLDFSKWPPSHQRVIFDADINSDIDDIAAITVVHRFADAGYCDIIAMGTSVPRNKVALSMDAYNTFYGRPNIPIGRVKHTNGGEIPFAWLFSEYGYPSEAIKYPCNLDTNNIPEACQLYKQVLAQQPDSSVTIVITGYPTNVAQLLLLPGGMDIVRKKVRMVVQMGGSNTCCCTGKEGNFWVDIASSKILTDSLPVPIVYSGFEVGAQISSGAGFRSQPTTSPARAAFGNGTRSSWDPCATLFAMAGLGPASNPYFKIGSDSGYQTVNVKDSSNKWICTEVAGKNPQGFIYQVGSDASSPYLVRVLDSLYALPNKPTSAHPSLFASKNSGSLFSVAFVSDKEVAVAGISHGSLELFDELGRIYLRTPIINERASVGRLALPKAHFYFYRIKQQKTVIAVGKITIR